MRDMEVKILDDAIAGLPPGDPFEIAAKLGLKVKFAKWHPVTAGEILFDRMEIVVNENAALPGERIVAHELGHFVVRREKFIVDDEEKFCDRFAERLAAFSKSE